jgi:hypothetical protein
VDLGCGQLHVTLGRPRPAPHAESRQRQATVANRGETFYPSFYPPERIRAGLSTREAAWLNGSALSASARERLLSGGLLVRVQPGEFSPRLCCGNPHGSKGQTCRTCRECSLRADPGAYPESRKPAPIHTPSALVGQGLTIVFAGRLVPSRRNRSVGKRQTLPVIGSEQAADYLLQYVRVYRDEHSRLIASPPVGPGLPTIVDSPYLDTPALSDYRLV